MDDTHLFLSNSDGANDENDDVEEIRRSSMYSEFFEEMVNVCTTEEAFLFSKEELDFLKRCLDLSYNSRYLLVRLALRKPGQWFRLDDITKRYGDHFQGSAVDAVLELCKTRLPPRFKHGKAIEIIDLTAEDDYVKTEDDEKIFLADRNESKSNIRDSGEIDPANLDLSVFAVDQEQMSLPELIARLTLEELKYLAKDLKVFKSGLKREQLVETILSSASRQTSICAYIPTKKTPQKKKDKPPLRQLPLTFGPQPGPSKGLDSRLRVLALRRMGNHCIRIEPGPSKLFYRLNLLFFRATEHAEQLMTPCILAKSRRRTYPKYEYRRTTTVFPTREALLAYEKALVIEARVDQLLEIGFKPVKTQQAAGEQVLSPKLKAALEVKTIWQNIWNEWQRMALTEDQEPKREYSLERFDPGHVLTRIVYKTAQCFATMKERDAEVELLTALLDQKRWRRGKRGAWYDRLALILMNYSEEIEGGLAKARQLIFCALEDPLTHFIYRHTLSQRLIRLEKKLNIPQEERTRCDLLTHTAEEVTIIGIRIHAHITLDKKLQIIDDDGTSSLRAQSVASIVSQSTWRGIQLNEDDLKQHQKTTKPKSRSTRSVWKGAYDEEVNVETFALQYYESLGFRGFHSEGRIVTTLFGLLFWDVLFHPVPGAFETRYQNAPLDLLQDTFYNARRLIIDARLRELEAGKARDILACVDERERPTETWCTGVHWDFSSEDLLEIAESINGSVLAAICKLLCEDYGKRCSGLPDLFIWKHGESKFVEVKGPGDSLQENQKVWIDVLVGAGMAVDLCFVEEEGVPRKKAVAKKGKKRAREVSIESEDDPDAEQGEVAISEVARKKAKTKDDDDDYDYIEARSAKQRRLSSVSV